MTMGWSIKILTALLGVVLLSTLAAANPLGAEEVERIESSRYNDSITPDSIQAQAGNLTEVSLNATGVTKTWQGFYGNVTGSLILADSTGNNFYDWNVSNPSGSVFASRDDSISWTSVACLSGAEITAEETFLDRDPTDPDSVTNTFSDTNHPQLQVGTQTLDNCPTTQAYGDGGSQDSEFWQILLGSEGNTIYTTILEDAATLGFNERPWHFQLLVGENGHTGAGSTTEYFFYVELS